MFSQLPLFAIANVYLLTFPVMPTHFVFALLLFSTSIDLGLLYSGFAPVVYACSLISAATENTEISALIKWIGKG